MKLLVSVLFALATIAMSGCGQVEARPAASSNLDLEADHSKQGTERARPECTYDREAELARGAVAIDQTEGQGWRPLYDAKCYIEAAELLREWQARNPDAFDLKNPREASLSRIMIWHEGQMWAFGGRTQRAIPLFERTYQNNTNTSADAWNFYVAGTLAFLRRDEDALEVEIARLARVPKPPGWDSAVGQDGKPISMQWPQNLEVLEGLLRCWDKPYAEAYLCRDIVRQR